MVATIPKTRRGKAILSGCFIEALLLICLFPLGGMAPGGGPTTTAGLIGLLGHLPAILPMVGAERICPILQKIPRAAGLSVAIVWQVGFWSVIASLMMSLFCAFRKKKKH